MEKRSKKKRRRYDIPCECLVILTETRVYSRRRQVIGLVGHIGILAILSAGHCCLSLPLNFSFFMLSYGY